MFCSINKLTDTLIPQINENSKSLLVIFTPNDQLNQFGQVCVKVIGIVLRLSDNKNKLIKFNQFDEYFGESDVFINFKPSKTRVITGGAYNTLEISLKQEKYGQTQLMYYPSKTINFRGKAIENYIKEYEESYKAKPQEPLEIDIDEFD